MERRRPWVLCIALVLLVVSGPGAVATPGPRRSAPDARGPSALVPADPIADLAASLDYDPDRIFRFVADEIRYEPYAGLLRGARGTLAAQAGNSVDKAVLLGALLDRSMVRYRFARGPLDDAATASLLATLTADRDGARRIAGAPLLSGLQQLADARPSAPPEPGSPGTLDEAQARELEVRGAQRLAATEQRLDATVAFLEDALGGAGIQLPTGDAAALPPDEAEAHAWIQMQAGPEWVDLDPTLPGALAGTPLASARETLDALPDALRHRVEFTVLLERLTGGQLVTAPVLTYAGFADEIAATPVTFGHVTRSGLESLGFTLSRLLGDGWLDHRPVLEIGARSLVADESVAFPVGGGTDLFGDVPSPGAGPVEGEATAEWLQVRVTAPGTSPQVARRTVFDRLPAALRAAGDLRPDAVEPLELVDVDGGAPVYPPLLGVRTFSIATGPTSAIAVAADVADPLGMFVRSYHSLRDTLNARMAIDAGARSFLDGPNIVSLTVTPDEQDPGHRVLVGLDIWQRHQAALPLAEPGDDAARSRLVAGILAHLAERLSVEALAGTPDAPAAMTGVGEVFEAAADQGIGTVVLRGAPPEGLPYGPEAAARIAEALADGDVVVVPARPVRLGDRERVGWWRVDPVTGATADSMDDGAGAEMAEYTVIVDTEVGRLICIGAMALAAAEVIVAAATLLGSFGASSVYWTFAEGSGVGGTSCSAV